MFGPPCSTQAMGCTTADNSNPNTTKRRRDNLALQQAATYSVDWAGVIEDDLDLSQTFNDYHDGPADVELNLVQNAAGAVEHIRVLTDDLILAHNLALAGQLGGGGGGEIEPVEAIFDSNTSEGMAVYVSSSSHVDLALGDAFTTKGVVGFARENVTADNTGTYTTMGVLTLDSWSNAIEGIGDLIPGALYYLSVTEPGKITPVATTTPGTYRTIVGRALTEYSLAIEIGQSLLI